MAMLCVLVALVYLYLSAGVHMLSTWRQSRARQRRGGGDGTEHGLLVRQHEALSGRATLEGEARQLGMMTPGRAALRRQRPAQQLSRA